MASATITATTAEILAAQGTIAQADAHGTGAASNLVTKAAESIRTFSVAAAAAAPARDPWRDWLWGFLAVLCLAQFYFVRELVAALALFAIVFAVIAGFVIAGYMLQKSWEVVIARLAALRQPVLTVSPVPHNDHKPA